MKKIKLEKRKMLLKGMVYIKAVKSYAALQLSSIIYERRGGSKETINLISKA